MTYRVPVGFLGLGDAAPVAVSNLGQIRSKDGYAYQVTPEDLIWLARSVQFEGGDHASTIWTYAQLQAKRRRRGSLMDLVRAHSQPINPRWDEASDPKCQQYPQRCTEAMLARRERARTTPWSSLRSDVRRKVLAWAQAKLPNPVPRAVDFADRTVSEAFIRRNPGTRVVKRTGNWYLATPDVLDWPADFVTMHYRGRVAGPGAALGSMAVVGGSMVLIGAGFAAWAWWRSRRR